MIYNLLATTVTADIGINLGDFFRITSISSLISGIVGAALIAASLAFILIFAWAAINWIISEGDKSKIEMARNKISNAFIGLVLTAAAWAVYLIVIYMLGLPVNAGGVDFDGGDPPASCPDYCSCSNGNWAAPGTLGPLTYDGPCYTCDGGSWGEPILPADDPSCPSSINCTCN